MENLVKNDCDYNVFYNYLENNSYIEKMNSTTYLLLASNYSWSTQISMVICTILTVIIVVMEIVGNTKNSDKSGDSISEQLGPSPPGPKPFPIIGNLPSMGGYEVPYQAFDALAKQYGPIISLRLGSVPTVVVNGIENIKEVLITKTTLFDSRPNFRRYHDLFSGNKQNCKSIYVMVGVRLIWIKKIIEITIEIRTLLF